MAKKKVKPATITARSRRSKITPMVALLVLEESSPCDPETLINKIKIDMRLTSDDEFEWASNYSFVPTVLTPLLEKGWAIRKYERDGYIFSITPAGKAEIARQF